MKKAFFLLSLLIFIISCQETTPIDIVQEVKYEDPSDITPTHFAVLEIEGMMCQKGCGSIIRKGLYETGGVSLVEVDYRENNPTSEIIVYYDDSIVSAEDMIDVISSLADNRYSPKLNKITQTTILE